MASWRSKTKNARSDSQRHGSADPDNCQDITDPQHWYKLFLSYLAKDASLAK